MCRKYHTTVITHTAKGGLFYYPISLKSDTLSTQSPLVNSLNSYFYYRYICTLDTA